MMPPETEPADPTDGSYAVDVGARLRAVRRQKRLSLQAVAAGSEGEFKASVLGAYERGERAISVPRLQRLARLYQVPVDQLLPGGESAPRAANDSARSGRVRIDLSRLQQVDAPEAASLQRFLTTIQVERGDFNGRILTIRADDLRVIGATFGLSVDEMIARLNELGLILVG